ncbi:MAG: hypothetical protein R2796_12395 [Chitinophagaceae bacterium]|nr:hypothetical protein [Chitinophagaceae bacterium]HQV06762.1 hypothetical protein [Chitinophagaceae bacterium]
MFKIKTQFILAICFFISFNSQAQNDLHFDKHFIDCMNKWVVIQPGKDSSLSFGFVYFDQLAGLSLHYEGKFKITSSGEYVAQKLENAGMIFRLKPTGTLMSIIPTEKLKELNVSPIPEWLSNYKTDTSSAQSLYNYGFLYNAWNQCATALQYLQKAKNVDPQYNKLNVEMAFSYNCLQLYDSAIIVLNKALKADSTDAYVNKELVYAQIKSGQLEKAAASCRKAIRICTDQKFNGENCYNILYTYFRKNDKVNFNAWLDEAKKWCAKNKQYMNIIEAMEKEMNKETP